MGTLAGSTIMLLSLTWGGCLLYGRCDLNDRVRSVSEQKQLSQHDVQNKVLPYFG